MTAKPSRALDRLQGVWSIVAMEAEGQKLPPLMYSGATVTITGDRFVSAGMGPPYEGTITVDVQEKLGRLDLHFDTGPPAGTSNPCIYALDGDRLTLCISMQSGKRPKAFTAPAGSGFALQTLVRGAARAKQVKAAGTRKVTGAMVASARAAAKPRPARGIVTELEGEWKMVSGIVAGVTMDADTIRWVRRVTHGDETTVYAGPQVMMQFTFTLDGEAKPKAIDYVHTAGAHKGKTQLGIYAITVKRLTVLMATPGAARPQRFDEPPEKRGTLTVWERA